MRLGRTARTLRTRLRSASLLALAVSLVAATAGAQPKRKPKPKPPPTPVPSVTPAGPAPVPPPTPPKAGATSVDVVVVEVAGRVAYLKPGAAGGVRRGAKVTIDRKEFSVVQSTSSFAIVFTDDEPLREQQKGQATIVSEENEKAKELPPPRPLATWQNGWAEEVAPASTQKPKYVPLGDVERDRRYDVRLSTAAGGVFPLGQRGAGIGYAQINARIHAEPFAATPIAFDFDGTVQRYAATPLSARDGSSARPTLWLREALASYSRAGYFAGIGRMKYAASTLGTLDGLRVRAPLGSGFSIGAFGGVLPDPLSGAPAGDAQRFGVEATYSRPELAMRPEGALVAHGSTFGGALDERRLSGVFGIYPGPARIGGTFEVSNFAGNNPWKASAIELTSAGVDASTRIGPFQFGVRADLRQPVRSRWLASYLPTTWFCRTIPAAVGAPPAPEVCDGSVSKRAVGTIDAGVELGKFSLVVGGTKVGDLGTSDEPSMTGGFVSARVVRIAKILRIDASANYSHATYLDMYGGTAGPGVSLFRELLDLSTYYRYAGIHYRSVDLNLVQSAFGGTAMLFPSSELLFTVQGEAITGGDVKAFMLLGTAMWRPRF